MSLTTTTPETRGYGAGTRAILAALAEGAQPVEALASLTGRDTRTIRRSLRRLVADGLVLEENEGRAATRTVVTDYVPCNDHKYEPLESRFPSSKALEKRCPHCVAGEPRFNTGSRRRDNRLPLQLAPPHIGGAQEGERLVRRYREATATGTFGIHALTKAVRLTASARARGPVVKVYGLT